MMPITQHLLSTIDACSNIVLAQIPAACERLSEETANTILRLPLEKVKLQLMDEPVSDTAVADDCMQIFAAVLAYYRNVMASASSHQADLGFQAATDSANNWRRWAGSLLNALVLAYENIPEAKTLYVDSCKLFNLHIIENPGAYKASFRISQTRELTAKIQAHEPGYIKPVKNYNYAWLAIAGIVGMFLTLPGSLLPLLEAAAMAVCLLGLWKGWKVPAMIAACIPAACRVISTMFDRTFLSPTLTLGYMHYIQATPMDGILYGGLHIATALLSFALTVLLLLYTLGCIHTDVKNTIIAATFGVFATAGISTAFIPLIDGYVGDVWHYVFLLCAACAATGIVASFTPASNRR